MILTKDGEFLNPGSDRQAAAAEADGWREVPPEVAAQVAINDHLDERLTALEKTVGDWLRTQSEVGAEHQQRIVDIERRVAELERTAKGEPCSTDT